MEQNKLKINYNIPLVYFVLIFFSIYISSDTVLFGTRELAFQKTIIIYFVVCIIVVFTNFKKLLYFNKSTFSYLAISIICILASIVVNSDVSGGYFINIFILIFSYIIYKYIPFHYFLFGFRSIIYYLALISIITYFAVLLFPNVLDFFPLVKNSAGVNIHNMYIAQFYLEPQYVRNMSIFREPNVFMIYLIFALIIENFLTNSYGLRSNIKYYTVIIIALLLTLSTGGYIALTLFFIYLTVANTKKLRFIHILYGLLLLFLVFGSEFSNNYVINKISTESGSGLSRFSSFVIPMKIFFENIFFGVGLHTFENLYQKFSYEMYDQILISGGNSTNTIFNKLATYGILFGGYFLFGLYKTALLYSNKYKWLFLFIVLFFLFSNQDLRYSLIFNIMIFYGIDVYSRQTILRNDLTAFETS